MSKPKIALPEARSMTKGERTAFKVSGAHPAYAAIKNADGGYRHGIELQEAMVDWIIDNIYGGASDDTDYGALCKLADDTYRLTYGLEMEKKAELEKN